MLPHKLAVGFGVVMLGFAALMLITGKVKYSSRETIVRAERPQAYWTVFGVSIVIGVALLLMAKPQ